MLRGSHYHKRSLSLSAILALVLTGTLALPVANAAPIATNTAHTVHEVQAKASSTMASYASKLSYLKGLGAYTYTRYAYKDLDGNGTKELIAKDDYCMQWIIYTLKHGKPVRVHHHSAASGNTAAFYKGGYVRIHDHISTFDTYGYYKLSGSKWKRLDVLENYHYCTVGTHWARYWTLNGKKVSSAKAKAVTAHYKKTKFSKKHKLSLNWSKL
jgi:hypothetical protein